MQEVWYNKKRNIFLMAKKQFVFSQIGDLMSEISKKVAIQIDDNTDKKQFISTGIYMLDAALSGSILNGGIQANRITAFAGESGVGKSFVAYGICREAQKKGYGIIYIDTEFAIEFGDLPSYGINTDKSAFQLIRTNKVEDISMALTQLLDGLKERKMKGEDIQPFLIVLDSVGMLSSNKEKTDLLEGKIKQDMTRAKAIAALFRSLSSDMGYLKIPMVVTNHTYLSMDLFPQEIMKGGNGLRYSASSIMFLTKAKLKTGEEDEYDLGSSGIVVTAKGFKNRLAKPKKVKFHIDFEKGSNPYTGLEGFCNPATFPTVGIGKGKMEVDKSSGEMSFKPGGNKWYIRHLDKSVFEKHLHRPEHFTPEVMAALEPFVATYFKYKSLEERELAEKEFDSQFDAVEDTMGGVEAADVDSADFFA